MWLEATTSYVDQSLRIRYCLPGSVLTVCYTPHFVRGYCTLASSLVEPSRLNDVQPYRSKNLDNVGSPKDLYAPTAPRKQKNESSLRVSPEEQNLINLWSSEKLPNKLYSGQFFWQFKISEEVYLKIKEALIALNFENKRTSFVRKHAFKIAFFLAEWFKREYDGYNGETGLSVLKISVPSSVIWDSANLPDNYLVNSGENEWIQSMYVLGGFPIKYVMRVGRFDSIIKNIYQLKDGEDFEKNEIEDIIESFDSRNSVYEESLQRGGSLFAYICELLNDRIPLSPLDCEKEPFSSYCEMIRRGKRICYDNFLSCQWIAYTDERTGIDCFATVQIGAKKNNCYIPEGCVSQWCNIPDRVKSEGFFLGLESEDGTKSERTIRFSRYGKSFVGWGDSTSLSLRIALENAKCVRAILYPIDDLERKKGIQIQHDFVFPNICQLFLSAPYKWSNKTDNLSTTALFFNAVRYRLKNEKTDSVSLIQSADGETLWIWARLNEQIILLDNETDEELSYNVKHGSLFVKFKSDKSIRYNEDGEVTHVFIDDEGQSHIESVSLMLGNNCIKQVKFFPFEAGLSPKKLDKYKVFFMQRGHTYIELTPENQPSLGMLQLRICHPEYKTITKKCYFVPVCQIATRNINTKIIHFSSKSLPVWRINEDNEYEKVTDSLDFDCSPYAYKYDAIPFRLGTENDYVELDIYRADQCREIYFNNSPLHKKTGDVNIPMIMKDQFKVCIIDEDGVRWSNLGSHVMIPLEQEEDDKIKERTVTDKDGISYYLYTIKGSRRQDNVLKISPKQINNYQFYYWSMNPQSDPVLLDCHREVKMIEEGGVKRNVCFVTVPLDKIKNEDNGIIFQSLRFVAPPNYVFPFCPSGLKRLMNIPFKDDVIIASMRIAVRHKVYFSQFYPIVQMFKRNTMATETLIGIVLKYLRMYHCSEDFKAMHRLAFEFLFDWIALPYNKWKSACRSDEDKLLAMKLFRSSPYLHSTNEKVYLNRILDFYWTMPATSQWRFTRTDLVLNRVLQSMRSQKGDFDFLKKRNDRGLIIYDANRNIEILTTIHCSGCFYRDLFNLITNKIINR